MNPWNNRKIRGSQTAAKKKLLSIVEEIKKQLRQAVSPDASAAVQDNPQLLTKP